MKTTDIKLICFDLDDTLWPVTPTLLRAEAAFYKTLEGLAPDLCLRFDAAALREHRLKYLRENPHLRHQVSRWRLESLHRALEETGHGTRSKAIAEEAFQVFLSARQQVTLFPHSEDVLDALSAQVPLIALTNGNADLSRIPVGRYFHAAYQAEQTGAGKPHPALFEQALTAVGCRPEEAVHIGDNLDDDIAGAKAAGLWAVQARLTETALPPTPMADGHFDDWRQLPSVIAGISKR